MKTEHKFPYNWSLKDAKFTKDKGKVFSCFACGGGSTMGYKLAGFDVIGFNEIDKRMAEVYITNHKPKYSFIEPIQTFKDRNDFPDELYNLDILDGSPPCSNFSLIGNREDDWGKEKRFKEGQAKQVLDTLFFDFIEVAKKLQPKVVVAENVTGILFGNAIKYVRKIYDDFKDSGYYCQHFILDASKMGVPQRRKRVFFIAVRNDIAAPILIQKDMFTKVPKLVLDFNEKEIPFREIEDKNDTTIVDNTVVSTYWDKCNLGDSFSKLHPKGHFFNYCRINPDRPINTVVANIDNGDWHYAIKRPLNSNELINGGTFPVDFNFCGKNPKYIIGMSVPPVMMAQIAIEIYNQILKNKIL